MNPGTSEFLIFLTDSSRTQLDDSNRIATTFATSPTNSVDGAVQRYIFVGEIHLSQVYLSSPHCKSEDLVTILIEVHLPRSVPGARSWLCA